VILAIVAFWFLLGSITAQADRVISQKNATQEGTNAIASFAVLKAAAPQAAQYEAAMQTLLPDQSGLITFNSWVNQAAKKYSVTATVAYQGDPVPATAGIPGTANFTMTAQGPENSIAPFMDYLSSQASGFILLFGSFDFTNNQAQESVIAQGTLYFR
jgi:hypothetical protein